MHPLEATIRATASFLIAGNAAQDYSNDVPVPTTALKTLAIGAAAEAGCWVVRKFAVTPPPAPKAPAGRPRRQHRMPPAPPLGTAFLNIPKKTTVQKSETYKETLARLLDPKNPFSKNRRQEALALLNGAHGHEIEKKDVVTLEGKYGITCHAGRTYL
jgi:hypothetical protein